MTRAGAGRSRQTAFGVSLALLAAFWDVQLSTGVAIDLGLVAIAVIRPEWTERVIG
jgi:hypothetical protein